MVFFAEFEHFLDHIEILNVLFFNVFGDDFGQLFSVFKHVVTHNAAIDFTKGGAVIPWRGMSTSRIDVTFSDVGDIAVG